MNKITMFVICLFAAVKTFMCVPVSAEAPKTIVTVDGRFYASMELSDIDGNKDMYYQFRSDDNTVWWLLTANEIGFVPQTLENLSASIITGGKVVDSIDTQWQRYTLTYDNNGTTAENLDYGCPPEYECECAIYDDIFICIRAAA